MVKTLVTDYYADSIYKVDISKLVEANITLAFIDLDNTLAQYDLLTPEKRTFELIKDFQNHGIEVIIISNNKNKRVMNFVSKLHPEIRCRYSRNPFRAVSNDEDKVAYYLSNPQKYSL